MKIVRAAKNNINKIEKVFKLNRSGGRGPAGLIDTLDTLTAKTPPVDTDLFLLGDSAASFANKSVSWASLKATLKTYFDNIYQAAGSYLTSVSVDGVTVTGGGTPGNPLVSVGGGGSASSRTDHGVITALAPATLSPTVSDYHIGSFTESWDATLTEFTEAHPELLFRFSVTGGVYPNVNLMGATNFILPGTSPQSLTALANGIYDAKFDSTDDGVNIVYRVEKLSDITAAILPATIVAAGDSLTADSGGTIGTWVDDAEAYAPVLTWINSGLSGDTAAGLWARWSTDVLAHNPDKVTILIGVNDFRVSTSAATVQGYVAQMLASAETNGIEVYLCKTCPWGAYSAWDATKQTQTDMYNTWVDTQAGANVTVIDTYSLLEDDTFPDEFIHTLVTGDGLHPDDAGAHRMAQVILDTVAPGFNSYETEDFTTYTELDPNNKITVTGTTVTAAAGYQAGTSPCYVAKSLSASLTDAGTVKLTANAIVSAQDVAITLCSVLGSYVANRTASDHQIAVVSSGNVWTLYETHLGNTYSVSAPSSLGNNLSFELQINNRHASKTATLIFYTAGADKMQKTAIKYLLKLTLHVATTCDKMLIAQHIGVNAATSSETISSVSKNF